MTDHVPPDHLSTLAYLWRQYDQQPRQLAFRAQTLDEWQAWRTALRSRLTECLGGFPTEHCDLTSQVAEVVEEADYRREKVYFYSEHGVAVPCYVLTPRSVAPPYRPVIALHGHGSNGARLIVGLTTSDGEQAHVRELNYDYARQLARHGFMVFAPTQRAMGERMEQPAFRSGDGPWVKSCDMVTSVGLLLGRTTLGLRLWDVMRTIDYIRTRPEARTDGLGCLGLSGGGTTTLYASALDERITCVVISGYLCTFRASIMSIVHCPDNYIPGILRYAEMADICALIAPRPLLIEHGEQDNIFPIEGTRQAYEQVARIYAFLGHSDRLDADFFPAGHRFSGRKAFAWLDRWLAGSQP